MSKDDFAYSILPAADWIRSGTNCIPSDGIGADPIPLWPNGRRRRMAGLWYIMFKRGRCVFDISAHGGDAPIQNRETAKVTDETRDVCGHRSEWSGAAARARFERRAARVGT